MQDNQASVGKNVIGTAAESTHHLLNFLREARIPCLLAHEGKTTRLDCLMQTIPAPRAYGSEPPALRQIYPRLHSAITSLSRIQVLYHGQNLKKRVGRLQDRSAFGHAEMKDGVVRLDTRPEGKKLQAIFLH